MSPETETPVQVEGGLLTRFLRGLTSLCMTGLLVLVCALILLRLGVFSVSLEWADEVVELLFAWMVFIGTAVVWGRREHIVVDLIPQMLAGTRAAWALEVVCCALSLLFLAVFTWKGATFTWQAQGNTSPILMLPRPLWYVSMPIGGAMMLCHTVRLGVRILRRTCPSLAVRRTIRRTDAAQQWSDASAGRCEAVPVERSLKRRRS